MTVECIGKTKPVVPGYYWYRHEHGRNLVEPVRVVEAMTPGLPEQIVYTFHGGGWRDIAEMDGDWYGPLTPPWGDGGHGMA